IAKCRPPKNRKPTPIEQATCANLYLSRELEIIKPRVIVCLGRTAMDYFKITQRGHPRVVDGRWIIGTFHPAYYLHSGAKHVISDIGKALQLAKELAYEEV